MTRYLSLSSFTSQFLVLGLVASLTTGAFAGNTVTTGGSFPGSPEVLVAPPGVGTYFGDDSVLSNAQTFQILSAGFSLENIFIEYEEDGTNPGPYTVEMKIFSVADSNASTHAEPPLAGDVLLTETVMFPAAGRTVARIQLDSLLSLPINAGTTGYGISFHDTINTAVQNGFEWLRTSGTPTGDVYAGGKAYEDGAEKSSGARDFTLALTTVPEPNSAVLILLAMAPFCGVSRRLGHGPKTRG